MHRTVCRKGEFHPNISLVVPTFNEAGSIESKLKNCAELIYPTNKLTVTVIDSGSNDGTQKLVKHFSQRNSAIRIVLLEQEKRLGKANALNLAINQVDGEMVVITDSDAKLEPRAVEYLIRNFADPQVGAVTGRLITTGRKDTATASLEPRYRQMIDILRLGESVIDSTPIFNGPIMAFRRDLYVPLPQDSIADDTELALSTRAAGWRAIFDGEALAYEFYPTSARPRFDQKTRRAIGVLQSFAWHKRMLFNPKYGKFGMLIFPAEFVIHAVMPTLNALLFIYLIWSLSRMSFPILTISLLVLLSSCIFAIQAHDSFVGRLILSVAAFIEGQLVMIVALFHLMFHRQTNLWKKIGEVRAA